MEIKFIDEFDLIKQSDSSEGSLRVIKTMVSIETLRKQGSKGYMSAIYPDELTFVIPKKIYDLRDGYAASIDPLTKESREYLKNLTGKELINELLTLDRGVVAWYDTLTRSIQEYNYLIHEEEWTPDEARNVLPGCTAVIVTQWI